MYTPNIKNAKPSAFEKLRDAWNNNPLLVIGVAAGAITAAAKLIDAITSAQGRRAYAKQINLKARAAKK
jgi:hypothetical protein